MDASTEDTPLEPILKAVSRSFYLSMVFLPAEMRPAISVGYLLARASDSVADNSQASPERRLEMLRGMKSLIMEDGLRVTEQVALLETIHGPMADSQESPAEATLLRHYADCLRLLRALPSVQQELTIRVLKPIHDGQIWDIEYFQSDSEVHSEDDTLRYCYQVAGCVGEYWTRLGREAITPYSRGVEFDDLLEAGIRYGQGLQLVNILRDQAEDAARGRHYLYGDPKTWALRARHFLLDGVAYSKRLTGLRLRFTAMLPALLGLKTLDKLAQAAAEGQREREGLGKVKISRLTVYLCMVKALLLSLLA